MKELPNINKLKAFIVPNMTDIIALLYNNVKPSIYTGEKFMDYIVI